MKHRDYKGPGRRRTRQRVAAKSASANPARGLDRELDDALDRDQPECFCGCGKRPVHLHHVVYRQHLRPSAWTDERNLVAAAVDCHAAHHNRSKPYEMRCLPDSVFEFAAEAMGGDAAFSYLRRRYAGDDVRLDLLLTLERAQ